MAIPFMNFRYKTVVYVKVDGNLESWEVDTLDYREARQSLSDALVHRTVEHGAILAVVK